MSRAFAGLVCCAFSLAACSATPTAPVTVVGYTLTTTTPVQTDTVVAGDSIRVTFKVVANESDGSSRPAVGDTVNIRVVAGGGTVGAATGVEVGGTGMTAPTGSDGTVSAIWVIGPTAGVQSLEVAASHTEVIDVELNVKADGPVGGGLPYTSRGH